MGSPGAAGRLRTGESDVSGREQRFHNRSGEGEQDPPDRLIGTIQKNQREQINVTLRSYKGHPFVDIRVYFLDGGQAKPSGKGCTIRPDKINDLIELLVRADQAAGGAR